MLDNLTYGPHGYSTHEESFAAENEYHSNSGSLQMMRPRVDSSHYSKQHMFYNAGTGTHGSYPDAWQGHPNQYPNGPNRPNGWIGGNEPQGGWSTSPNGYYNQGPGGKLPGMYGPSGYGYGYGHPPGRVSTNNMTVSSEYETYHSGPGRTSVQNYGMHSESYDDYANDVHNGRQKFECKAL